MTKEHDQAHATASQLLVPSPTLNQLSYHEMVENLTIFRQSESAVDHWELQKLCDMASTASKMASTYTKSLLGSPKRAGLQFLPLALRLFLLFIDF